MLPDTCYLILVAWYLLLDTFYLIKIIHTNKMHNIGTELSYATLRTKTQKWKWPLMEDNLWWKTTFNRKQPLAEDNLWRKMTFDERRPFAETTFEKRWTMVEDNLWRKTTFDVRRRSIGSIVYYLKKMFTTPPLGSHSTTDPKPEILSAV